MSEVLASRPLPTATEAHDLVAKMRRKQEKHARGTAAAARRVSPMTLAMAASGPGGIGPAAWKLLLKGIPLPTLRDDENRAAALRVLQPFAGSIEAPTHGPANPWQTGGTVAVGYVALGRLRGKPAVLEGAWSLVVTDFALCRMAQAGVTDLAAEVLLSHDALLRAPVSLAPALLEADSYVLPAGPGGFLIRMRGVLLGDGDAAMLATASDWIPTGEFTDVQRQQAARMVAEHTEHTLGERWLLPAPMRPPSRPFAYIGDAAPACNIPT